MSATAQLGPYTVGPGQPLLLIAGPCVLESREHALNLAAGIAEAAAAAELPLVFKASFDKANRSSLASQRGPGLEAGCEILAAVKEATGLPVTTDIHLPDQAAVAAGYGIDALQIPAFLCRQTDLLLAAAATGRAVNIKKGQFLSPQAIGLAVDKVRGGGGEQVLVTERGTFFGYQNLVNDMTAIPQMADFGVPVIFDATHSVQQPPTTGGITGGNRRFVPVLSRAAVAAGCHGLFLEVHEAPERSPSDAANIWPLADLPGLLAEVKAIHAAVQG